MARRTAALSAHKKMFDHVQLCFLMVVEVANGYIEVIAEMVEAAALIIDGR